MRKSVEFNVAGFRIYFVMKGAIYLMLQKNAIGSADQKKARTNKVRLQLPLHLMMIPGIVLVVLFCYIPMFGIVMAFQDYNPLLGFFKSPWVGLDNFIYLFSMPDTLQVVWNTLYIAISKIIGNLLVPVVVALLLNEIGSRVFQRSLQTIIYLPYFLSWIILATVFIDILSPSSGAVNKILGYLGVEPIYFLGDQKWFPLTMVFTDIWKGFGYGTIVYLAALTGIDPTLYEAAVIDGANRWQQTWHVTLPGIRSTVILMMTLQLGNVLNAGFDQIFNLLSPVVYKTGDIIDTLVYRMGLINTQYSLATAVGLFKSVISMILIALSYWLADKFANYRIF